MLLSAENLSFSYITDEIFHEASFRIDEKERIGLVGPNGSGKSTLLKLLTKNLTPDTGQISKNAMTKIGYLEQFDDLDESTSLQTLFESAYEEVDRLEEELLSLSERIAVSESEEQEKLLDQYARLQEKFESHGAYEKDSRIRGMAQGLGFDEMQLAAPFSLLSGGQKTRAKLGVLLLQEPDVLLLDEPNNYLDLPTLGWLEDYLKGYPGSVVVVSHDRYFLDAVCTRVDEISRKKIISYPGDYTHYTVEKEKRLMLENQSYLKAVKELNRQQQILRRYRDFNSKQSSRHARSREHMIAKMALPEKVEMTQDAHFSFEPKIRSADEVLTVTDLKKSFDKKTVFENVSFHVARQERIGIIGANGIGKSTLFRLITRQLMKDSGKISLGRQVIPAVFDQEHLDLRAYSENTLIEAIREEDVTMTDAKARNILASFLFTGEDVFKQVKMLSGGERARLMLARLMLSEANFLLLDEPTNHIDMQTKEILEQALSAYQGTLLFISHDRYFLNRLADKILVLEEDGMQCYLGNYDDYLRQKQEAAERENQAAAETLPTKTQMKQERKKQQQKRSQIRSLKNRVSELEEAIEQEESRKADLEEIMCRADFYQDPQESQKTLDDYENVKKTIDTLTSEWEEALLAYEEETND